MPGTGAVASLADMTPPGPERRPAAHVEPPVPGRSSPYEGLASGGDPWGYTVELLTATLTWGGIGWLADRWLGTAPWLLVIGLIVGNAAGIYLLWVRTGGSGAAPGSPHPTADPVVGKGRGVDDS